MISRSLLVAMLCAAAVTAEFVAGKATRDALLLTSLGPAALPAMLVVTALCSIGLVALYVHVAQKVKPSLLVPLSFLVSGILFLVEWYVRSSAPSATAVIVYLHVSGAGPLLASGFWLIASERFDPSTAKARFGQIAGAGTVGGILGAVLSERVAAKLGAPPMLLFLGALQFVAAWLVWMLAKRRIRVDRPADISPRPGPAVKCGLKAATEAPHLRDLMALVLLGTTSAALLEYLFKVKAVETLGSGDSLLRFFALYYAFTSLASFVLQVVGSSSVQERFGLALTTSSPSIAVLAGSIATLVAPGFGSLAVARACESVLRGSWFRSGYELFFTPIPVEEKRIAKPVIDVGLDRLGDAIGGVIVRLVLIFVSTGRPTVILVIAIACSVGAVLAASHLNRWYLRTLEKSLVKQGGDVDAPTVDGMTARMLSAVRRIKPRVEDAPTLGTALSVADSPLARAALSDVQDVLALRLGDRDRIIEVLSRGDGLRADLVAHVIPLLARADVADYALFALRKVAEEHVGELTDAMIDPARDPAVRQRLARVLSIGVSQRAVDGLLLAVDDERFDVRAQAARSLVAIAEKNRGVVIDPDRIQAVVLHEVGLAQPIWNGRLLLAASADQSPLDAFVNDRAGQSLAHIFVLLSLVFPREPIQIAFRSLNSPDRRLRGTAIEYLEEILPPAIRTPLWPFLVPDGSTPAPRPRSAVVSELLRDSESVTLFDLARKHA